MRGSEPGLHIAVDRWARRLSRIVRPKGPAHLLPGLVKDGAAGKRKKLPVSDLDARRPLSVACHGVSAVASNVNENSRGSP